MTGKKKLAHHVFVKRAIRRLCEDENVSAGIHATYSELLGALHLYYGDTINPFVVICDMVRKGQILAQPMKGGLWIYDPRLVKEKTVNVLLGAVDVRVTHLDVLSCENSEQVEKKLKKQLAILFDFTEAAYMCENTMDFRANRNIAPKGTDGHIHVDFTQEKGPFSLEIDLGENIGCMEVLISVPFNTDFHAFKNACFKAVKMYNGQYKKYELRKKHYVAAKKTLAIIVEKSRNKKGVLNFSRDTACKMIIIHANQFDQQSFISKDVFLEILRDSLMDMAPNRGNMATLVRYFTSGDEPLLELIQKPVSGYKLTRCAGQIIKEANGDLDSDSAEESLKNLTSLLRKKHETEKNLAISDEKMNAISQSIHDHEGEILCLTEKLEKAVAYLKLQKIKHRVLEDALTEFDLKIYTAANIL